MPFVERTPDGRIVSVHREADGAAREWLDAGDPLLLEFVGASAPAGGAGGGFTQLDADFVRVIEDVIDALIGRNILNLTDLPPEAQQKLMRRRGLRDQVGRQALDLFGTDVNRDGVI